VKGFEMESEKLEDWSIYNTLKARKRMGTVRLSASFRFKLSDNTYGNSHVQK
jgi:hypothetical protein